MRRYEGEDEDDYVDRVTDEAIQNDVDDAEAKRAAAQTSPELLSLVDARIEGAKAGRMGLSASLNPYQAGCPEHDAWEQQRSCAIGAALNSQRRAA